MNSRKIDKIALSCSSFIPSSFDFAFIPSALVEMSFFGLCESHWSNVEVKVKDLTLNKGSKFCSLVIWVVSFDSKRVSRCFRTESGHSYILFLRIFFLMKERVWPHRFQWRNIWRWKLGVSAKPKLSNQTLWEIRSAPHRWLGKSMEAATACSIVKKK